MWLLSSVLLWLVFMLGPAGSEILYARPDGDQSTSGYLWAGEIITDSVPLQDAVAAARAAAGSRPLEIRLLRRSGLEETQYSLNLGKTGLAIRWRGTEANRLTIRGQVDRSGGTPRALTTIVGQRSLREILCKPHDVDLCSGPPPDGPKPDGPTGKRQDLLEYLSRELEPEAGVTMPDIRLRLDCVLLWEAAFVDLRDLGFRECWLAAVAAYASSNIGLHGSLIDGGSYAFAAIARKGHPETAHTFEITGNVWRQSPASYRPSKRACDIRNDWSCPVSAWSDIPWAVVHHYFWSPLNGALFVAKDILGNVRIADNRVTDAYNGVRVRLSEVCLENPNCREIANAGFEITGNRFENIRDNAVEPESQATYWIVKHNTIINNYAPISTDGVAGHDVFVFGNVFALDDAPGSKCTNDGWVGSRQFRPILGARGRWSADMAEGDDASCSTHMLGTVIKMGTYDDLPDGPVLDRLFFFNNSVRTRSPLFRGSPGPPITSYNNLVEFIGCGANGPRACRQADYDDPSCAGQDVWTRDGQSIFAKCFAVEGRPDRHFWHLMRFNAYNRAPGPELDAIDRDRVAIPAGGTLGNAGCGLAYADGDLTCLDSPGPIGAVLPDGHRFDLALPFRFPFTKVLLFLNGIAAPK
ncbi:hypothetical protein M446_1261 [Methylobacterium sp. 4-46]|uniref:hypothetical protein n=1 Tax=unclassified Methylobacterium TaxID=2615210 RepID=UPI000152C130|nr:MULTISPECIES: hypothetical protein [Methylobacterium]ACA15784.1 hypothetical protein M446_1261 [Methylobacterium sp. 4-46]WFT81514.1 hypothetical protein QA634_06415 [Methylobacterium nodulans]